MTDKKLTPDANDVAQMLLDKKQTVNDAMESIAVEIGKLAGFLLPLSYNNADVNITVTTPKKRRGGGGKRNFIEYEDVGFASARELCDYHGIDVGSDSAVRKLKSVGIEYDVIDSERYEYLKASDDNVVYVDGMHVDDDTDRGTVDAHGGGAINQ